MNLFQRTAKVVNTAAMPLFSVPFIGPILGKSMVTISYTGRKSGKRFTLPVGYKRTGNEVVIRIALPDQKQWWRNFVNGGELTFHFVEGDRSGHAVATRDGAEAKVTATLA